jgi:hypothetical protein
MNILIICNHYAVCSGRYITDAFKRLGHDVRHTGAPMGRSIWGLTLPAEYEWTPDAIEDGWTPDLIVVADSDPTALVHTAKTYPPPKVPVVVWGVDNHVRDYRFVNADHYFLAHFHPSIMQWQVDVLYKPSGGNVYGIVKDTDMTHLPCAYDPVYFTPSQIPYEEREYDVCMIGVTYPHRAEIIKRLKAAGIKVLWGTGLVFENYAAVYQNSRISLCLSVAHDVGQRIFETAAMGCCVLSDPCPDFDILKPEGVIVMEAGTRISEAVQTILSQPSVAQTAIAKSMAWVKNQTWDARAQVVLAWFEEEYGERAYSHNHS